MNLTLLLTQRLKSGDIETIRVSCSFWPSLHCKEVEELRRSAERMKFGGGLTRWQVMAVT